MARDVEDEDVDVVELGSRPVTGGFFAAIVDMIGVWVCCSEDIGC